MHLYICAAIKFMEMLKMALDEIIIKSHPPFFCFIGINFKIASLELSLSPPAAGGGRKHEQISS
jgi:hypothetical protein